MAIYKDFYRALALVFISVLFTVSEAASLGDDSAGTSGADIGGYASIIGGAAGVLVLVVAVAICVEKRVHVENLDRGPPYWTRSLVFKQEYNGGLSSVSDGMNNLSPFHVIRDRLGQAVTDGARWDVGFTEGKHVFEVVWPAQKNRGINSSIGLATTEVPLKKQGRLSLVGHHSQSWGFDLSSRKMVHAGKRTGGFGKQVPDRFFVYVDMDGGKVGFGEDVKTLGNNALFYGYLINNVRTDRKTPMYLMIGVCAPREEVQIYYIGSDVPQGGFSLVPPAPMPGQQVVVYNTVPGQQLHLQPQQPQQPLQPQQQQQPQQPQQPPPPYPVQQPPPEIQPTEVQKSSEVPPEVPTASSY